MDKYINIAADTTLNLPAFVKSVICFTGKVSIENIFDSLDKETHVFILGGGSNVVLPENMHNTVVIKIQNKGITIIEQDSENVLLEVASGEIWDDVVLYACNNGYAGIEAMSAIPGIAGATPIQNVGAYGQEIKDVLVSVDAYDRINKTNVTITNKDCCFDYRMSRFKKDWKNRFVITSIIIRLSKKEPEIPLYKGVNEYFMDKQIQKPHLLDIRQAITAIRWSKLPKPNEFPNCGSFFENPIIENNLVQKLLEQYPNMPTFPTNAENMTKVSAGWLIEQAGLKDYSFGTVGTHEKNALVLVNCGGASQSDVVNACGQIIKKVYEKFSIELETEPEIIKEI